MWWCCSPGENEGSTPNWLEHTAQLCQPLPSSGTSRDKTWAKRLDQSQLNKFKWQANLTCKTASPTTIRPDSWVLKPMTFCVFLSADNRAPGIKFTSRKKTRVFLSLCTGLMLLHQEYHCPRELQVQHSLGLVYWQGKIKVGRNLQTRHIAQNS